MTETSPFTPPVINVIEHDIPGRPGFAEQSGGDGRTRQLDATALDAVSARRRREFDAARSRLRDQAIRDDAKAVRQPGTGPTADAPSGNNDTARVPLDQPPERVRKRYLRAGHQYFLKDAPYQLAFEDLGPYLVTEHNRPDVVESMVDIVAAKSWRRVRVSGHEVFRSEVWLRGTLLGIEVSGYEPKMADLARLADARQSRLNNRIEADASMRATASQARAEEPSTPAPASASTTEMPGGVGGTARAAAPRTGEHVRLRQVERQPATGDEPDAPRRYAGELREHDRAPHQNNPARSDSYYVMFRDATGADHVVWGVDLERAVLESRAEPGHQVTLENLGRRLVTVNVPILDDHGMVVGEEEKDVYRNTWQVEVVERERSAAGPVSRSGRAFDHATAPIGKPMNENRQGRQPSTISDEEKVLHLAVLVGAMREQGFSARSISRVQRRAEQMLDAFGKEGIPLPRPKVFDPTAPSERDSRARPGDAARTGPRDGADTHRTLTCALEGAMPQRERLCVELGEMRPAWDQWCARRGRTVGEGVRLLMASALRADADDTDIRAEANLRWGAVGDPRARIEIRLARAELEAVERRAVASGQTSNRWIVALIRAQFLREPQFGVQEMQVLADSNRQLAAINRWLGQIARDGSLADIGRNGGGNMDAIRDVIDVHLRAVAAVIRANLDRWSR
ncbi:LPD7 domain-containing protein [Paraburkholderia sp. 40]|uniref:LPD7 domain-containing protein n=1 Tax=Paraburkholderia sp. 40 TaxID=2991059 RepID=UPI003D225F0B